MENKKTLEKYYKEYKIIDAVIKEKEKSRIDLFKELNELKAGRFYLTLTDEQKREFRDIYSDSTIIRYHLNEVELEEYKFAKEKLISELIVSDVFPLNKKSEYNIYIKDGIETFNALTNESTVNLEISDTLKEFIQTVIGEVYGFNDLYTVDDIPLIKVIEEKSKNGYPTKSKFYNEVIPSKVKRIKNLDRQSKTYRNLSLDIKSIEENLKNDQEEIEKSDSSYKDLIEEEILAVKYELLMLDGKKASSLCKNLPLEDREKHLCALTKAYYNLTNIEFRKRSNYFSSVEDIIYADFETANKDINEQIIKMKRK